MAAEEEIEFGLHPPPAVTRHEGARLPAGGSSVTIDFERSRWRTFSTMTHFVVPFFGGIYIAFPYAGWLLSLQGVHFTAVMVVNWLWEWMDLNDACYRVSVRIIDETNYPHISDGQPVHSA